MKKTMVLAMLVMTMVACQKGSKGDPGAVVTVPAPVAPLTDAQAVVADENDYRLSLGQSVLTQGALSCTLYSVTGGDRIQASIAGHNTLTGITQVASYSYSGAFNQPDGPVSDGMNVLPPALRSTYQNMYLLRCTGYVVITENDTYAFELTSDDGSVLYVDGAKLIDNDNNHGATVATGVKALRKGVHAFRLDYAQTGAGNQALIVRAGSASGPLSSIDPQFYAH